MLDFFKPRKMKAHPGPLAAEGLSSGLNQALDQVNYVVLDTELTGLDKKQDSIVSFGAVKMSGASIRLGETYYRLVKPRSKMNHTSVVIHEITPSEVDQKPSVETVLPEFLAFCGTAVLVGHFLSIDLGFINREMKRTRKAPLVNPVLDTWKIVEWLRWNSSASSAHSFSAKDFELYEIARSLGIPVQGAHNALMDAFMTAQVFQRLIPRLSASGIRTLGEALRVGDPDKKPLLNGHSL